MQPQYLLQIIQRVLIIPTHLKILAITQQEVRLKILLILQVAQML